MRDQHEDFSSGVAGIAELTDMIIDQILKAR